ncbi:MAG: type II toxin-antitoxin system RelB/DinJ family antitoxin [Treponema sp.]|jgi:DNA-damage-inducible protein J|nr:type II toxin-antitoxin system RelB/DinJ family antitoxin [Treponema sp.]
MATIQIRIDDTIKRAADSLFTSLGLDTSTAVRMFIAASLENNGFPFAIAHKVDSNTAISEAIERRKSGFKFLTAEQSLANMRAAIKSGAEYGH